MEALDRNNNSPLHRGALSEVLFAFAADSSRQRISIGDLLSALGDRALGALLFIFAFPNVLPMPPGASVIFGAPLIFLAAQLALGRKPWLPAIITQRSIPREDFLTLIRRMEPWLAKAEKLLRPRFSILALPPMENLLGLLCLVLAIIVTLPIPLGNMLPALAISLIALGVLERDGLWILAGLAAATISAVVVSGVMFAMIKASIFLFTEILS